MDAVGLTVGVVGLAGLFSSCLEAVDKVQTYRSFGPDSHVLDTKFKATEVRLEEWGRRNWLDQEFPAGAKLLWINGPAGFGKTILCAHVVERLSSTLKTPVAHFFFSSDLESREDPVVAVRSWISQIVSQHEGAFEHVRQKWEADSDPVATRANAVMLLTQLLRVVPGCMFIVDGLDECTYLDDRSTSVTKFIKTVKKAVVGTNTRVLVVSRAEPEIRTALTDDTPESFAEYEIAPDDVRSDTAAYSRDIVDRQLPNKSDDVRSALSEAMTDQCEGQFLWLKMQEKSLRKGMNKKQLQHTIEETPTGLDQLYDRSWQRITQAREGERPRIYALLRWAAFALRPLTVCEVTEAVLIDESEDLPIEALPDAVDDDYIDKGIVRLCGPLLEVRSQHSDTSAGLRTVHLTHFSVKQYLLCNLPTPGWIRENERLQDEYQNTLLAKACLHYINIQRVWQE
ncbi:ankyrin-1, partial [Ilyonectria robusta]|uniref:ankyrin-1 n=1 Tax=Ilyonectria robusta TaxID=1079257 RepID=UPI001E8DBF95